MSVQVVMAIALSTLVGVSLGLLGGGGSILAVPLLVYVAGIDVHVIVPALTLLARLPIHTAVGTSLLVIAVNAAAGLAGHLRQGPMPLDLTAAFTTASVIGALVGVPLAGRVDAARLRRAFAVFVIVIGLALLAANVHPG